MNKGFDEGKCLEKIRHYLPSQAPLKDFVHHNTLHAFQDRPFFEALQLAHEVFGYQTMLPLAEYRQLFRQGKIPEQIIEMVLRTQDSKVPLNERKALLFEVEETGSYHARIGQLRKYWKESLQLDLNTIVHLNLFKLVGSYLDQGISANHFPNGRRGLINSILEIESFSVFEIFHSGRVKDLLRKRHRKLEDLLKIILGDERYYEQYLFDQQFAHPGWSGIVSLLDANPQLFYSPKAVSFQDYVYLELLLEIDALDKIFGEGKWSPLGHLTNEPPIEIFAPVKYDQVWEVRTWWQQCFEMAYFDQVLAGIGEAPGTEQKQKPVFQAFFCIDDREESIRRHIEMLEPDCETFGTPAHYNLPVYYRPAGGKFNTQVCPGVIQPRHIILDDRGSEKSQRDLHFDQRSHGPFGGWLISQTVGFWSGLKLFINIFRPSVGPAHSSSFEHVSHKANLIIENKDGRKDGGLQVGFTVEEMAGIVESELGRTGLVKGFAPLIYLFGHGGSSTNNPYYAGYNCGACSGKPSSLNSRVFAMMANRKDVRDRLRENGIDIPSETQFLAGLHDTTRDEFVYYDLDQLSQENIDRHHRNKGIFNRALANNAKERARQFLSINIKAKTKTIHADVKKRSVALFEPRPELNHSNNCLCIVAPRPSTRKLFFDQRAFLNSYDWRLDPEGKSLESILGAATPVCGGINLEYFFSRVDNENFGAGSKLPHNVVGLFGVANGIEGDLRTGLPIQMVEVHDPLRLMMVIEQKPSLVLEIIHRSPSLKEWYGNGWVLLAVVDPEDCSIHLFFDGKFRPYQPTGKLTTHDVPLDPLFESTIENLPVFKLK